jgi:hypothetical protein
MYHKFELTVDTTTILRSIFYLTLNPTLMGTSALKSMNKLIHKRTNSFQVIQAGTLKSNSCLSSVHGMRTASIRNREDPIRLPPVHHIGNMDCALSNCENINSNDAFAEHVLRGRQSQKLGNYMEALTHFQYALEFKKKSIASEKINIQIEYANVLFYIGAICMTQCKNVQRSADAFEQCLEWRIYCLGSSHLDVPATMYCLARVHMMMGDDYIYAVTLLNEALSILLVDYPNHMNSIVAVWKELARAQFKIGELDDAESSLKEIRKLTAQISPFL